jgi:hypothetical protein
MRGQVGMTILMIGDLKFPIQEEMSISETANKILNAQHSPLIQTHIVLDEEQHLIWK